MKPPWEILKLLADPTRLRLLCLLQREELAVAELQEILEMAQSRISSQLSLLRKAEMVVDRREGRKSFYSIAPNLSDEERTLLATARDLIANRPEGQRDQENLERLIGERRQVAEKYFNLIAGRLGRNYCPGRSWEAIGHFLLHLVPSITVADLGAGEGLLSQLLARRAEHVTCIDISPRMVEVGTDLAKKNGLDNLEYRLGDIEKVPLPDGSVDLAILSQALHHAEHPQEAVNEAFRILKSGGTLLVLDLKEHGFEKARELYADRWLGFKENTLHHFLKSAGFKKVEVTTIAQEEQEPNFATLLASGKRD